MGNDEGNSMGPVGVLSTVDSGCVQLIAVKGLNLLVKDV